MMEIILYAVAALFLPVSALIITHVVIWQADRALERERRHTPDAQRHSY